MKKIIKFSEVEVHANYVFGTIAHYSLYVNGEHQGTFVTKEDLQHEILLLQITELNRGLNKI